MAFFVLYVLLLSTLESGAVKERWAPPTFAQFPVSPVYAGPAHRVDLTSHPRDRRYRTILREGTTVPPDFAGHYKFVVWGCGTGCQESAFVDLESGRVYFGPMSALGIMHRADSALLVIDPPEWIPRDEAGQPPEEFNYHSYYYRWDERHHDLLEVYTDDPKGFR